MTTTPQSTTGTARVRWRRRILCLGVVPLLILGTIVILGLARLGSSAPRTELVLGDGRILQIEGVTYGTDHRMGRASKLERFRPWLPSGIARMCGADVTENVITTAPRALVIWVNAISASGRTNVDCQRIRVQIVDKNGEVFGETTRSWFGSGRFWRVGHVFDCYPRDEHQLNLQVTTWSQGLTSSAQFTNPQVVFPVKLTGSPLPQSRAVGDIEIRMEHLNVRTNGQGTKGYYETASRYFEPVLEVWQKGRLASGWEEPEWNAEDSLGNRGQFLGTHQPALKFYVSVHPSATNRDAAQLIAILPQVNVATMGTNALWWNRTNSVGSNTLVALGVFPPGTHTFSEGVFESSSLLVSGPSGGAPSGWTSSTRRLTPMKEKRTFSHYTSVPVIYVRVSGCIADDSAFAFDHPANTKAAAGRLAVRFSDGHGGNWVAETDMVGDGIQPFMLKVPPGVTNVVPELEWLKPARAEFLVETGKASLH